MVELLRLFDDLEFFMQRVREFDVNTQHNLNEVLAGKLINLTTCLKTAVAVYPSNEPTLQQNSEPNKNQVEQLDTSSIPTPALLQPKDFVSDNSQFSTQQSDDRNSHIMHLEHVMHVDQDLTPNKSISRAKISVVEEMEWTPVTSKKKISRPTQTWYRSFSDQVSMDQHGQFNDTVNVQPVDNLVTRTVSTGNDDLQARRPCLQNTFSVLQDLEPDIDYF